MTHLIYFKTYILAVGRGCIVDFFFFIKVVYWVTLKAFFHTCINIGLKGGGMKNLNLGQKIVSHLKGHEDFLTVMTAGQHVIFSVAL